MPAYPESLSQSRCTSARLTSRREFAAVVPTTRVRVAVGRVGQRQRERKEHGMYIGLGTLVVIIILILLLT